MLARDSVFFRVGRVALIAALAVIVSACAQKEQVTLVNDPSVAGGESALPWNQQEKWEGQGQFGGMAERMQSGSRR